MTSYKNKKVLLSEMDHLLLGFFSKKFQELEINFEYIKDANTFIDSATRFKPDLFLVDISFMPIQIIEFFTEFRKDSWGSGCKIFIISDPESTNDDFIIRRLSEVKPTYFLDKNHTDIDELLEKVLDVLS